MNISTLHEEERKAENSHFHFNGFWRAHKQAPYTVKAAFRGKDRSTRSRQCSSTSKLIAKLNFALLCNVNGRLAGTKKLLLWYTQLHNFSMCRVRFPRVSASSARRSKSILAKPNSMWNSLYHHHPSSVYNLTNTAFRCEPSSGTNTMTRIKDMKSEPRKKKEGKNNVNETKNLCQTFLSRSTDKVLQPRKVGFSPTSAAFCANTQFKKKKVGSNNKTKPLHGK